MKKILPILLTIIILLGQIKPVFAAIKPTNAEKLSMQTKIFETNNPQKLYELIATLFEQNGFEITSEAQDLGFLCAKKVYVAKKNDAERLSAYSIICLKYIGTTIITYGLAAPLLLNQIPRIKKELEKKTMVIEANANFITINNQTKVRISMIEEIYDNKDVLRARFSPRKIEEIDNPQIYKQIFETLAAQLK